MAEMTEVVVFTVTGVDTKNIDSITKRFSKQIRREVGSHIEFGTDLVFSAIAPKSVFTRSQWAGVLRDVCASRDPVKWITERVMDW